MRLCVSVYEFQEAVISAGSGDVRERPQRARREQRITITPKQPRRRCHLVGETAKDYRLPDPCLAMEKYDATATVGRVREGPAQTLQHELALQELSAFSCDRDPHRQMMAARAPLIKQQRPTWVVALSNLGGGADASAP
jgi:hypothetical protein